MQIKMVGVIMFLFFAMASCSGDSSNPVGPSSSACSKANNGLTVSLNDRQIYDFDSKTIVTSPTNNNNVIQYYVKGSAGGKDELTIGSNIDHGNSSYTSTLSIARASGNVWSTACDYNTELTNSSKSIIEVGNIYIIRLSDGTTIIKLQIEGLDGGTVSFYWESV